MNGFRVNGDSVDSLQLDGEAVLLNLETHGYYGMNATATAVWELVKAHPGVQADDIAGVVARRFGGDAGVIAADIALLLNNLVHHHLVAECAAATLPVIRVEPSTQGYLAPALHAYGDLDTLILSGE